MSHKDTERKLPSRPSHMKRENASTMRALPHSSTISSRRRSRIGTPVARGPSNVHMTQSATGGDGAKQSSALRSFSVRHILGVSLSGVAYAILLVNLLGPPTRDAGGDLPEGVVVASIGGHVQLAPLSETAPTSDGGHVSLDSSAGVQHTAFLGQHSFPEQFEGWEDEANGPGSASVRSVDVEPLTGGSQPLPRADLLMAILSGSSEEARARRDTLRELYDKYEGWVTFRSGNSHGGGGEGEQTSLSFKVIFVVSSPDAPPGGELVGDVLYVNAPGGYRKIVHKVKYMMGLVRFFDFKYLLKADDDTFVCMRRLASFLHEQPQSLQGKIYAGVPTACHADTVPEQRGPKWQVGEVIKDRNDKWYDQKFVHHTLSGLDCYPVYMQGAFYVLAHPLVEHLYRGREHYDTFVNEDVTIGSWLLGVDRALATIHDFASANLWTCSCGGDSLMRDRVKKEQVFFHNCKADDQLRMCSNRLMRPPLGC